MVHILLAMIVLIAFIGRDKDKTVTRIAFLLLLLFAALRYMYGSDYASYQWEYGRIKNGKLDAFGVEILYTLLNLMSPTFYILVAVISTVFVIFIYRWMTRNLPLNYVWVGLLIFIVNPYLFLVNLSAMRQCLAMILFIVAVHFAQKKKPLQYLAMIALAVMFHKSAVILLPFYFLLNDKPVKAGATVAVLAVVGLGLYVLDIRQLAILAAEWFEDAQYIHYATNAAQNSVRATLLTSVFFLFVLTNLPRLKGRALIYGKLYLVGTMLGVLSFRLSMLTRIQMYFDIFSIIVIPAILIELRKEGRVRVDAKHPIASAWACVNHYAMPILIFVIYALRYYSFFNTPTWEPYFSEYRTIFELIG
jgi:hypothetical protein